MLKFSEVRQFAQYLFDEKRQARLGTQILEAILNAQSPRLSEIARQMPGRAESNYKRLCGSWPRPIRAPRGKPRGRRPGPKRGGDCPSHAPTVDSSGRR